MTHPAASGQATVLVVDDSAEERELFAYVLGQAGYRVLAADGAPQAQQLVGEQWKIDILVTDFNMPVMNGVELARWFQSRLPLSQVLLVSGNSWELEAYLKGAVGLPFLEKTEAFTQLVGLVKKLLAEPRMESQEFGAAQIAQQASAETIVLREILARGYHSRSRV